MKNLFFASLLLVAIPAFATDKNPTKEFTLENKLVNGKKAWLPAQIEVKAPAHVKIKLVNTLAEPHGFEAVGKAPALVVKANETQTIEFDVTKKDVGEIPLKCQLHPAHVSSKLVVK